MNDFYVNLSLCSAPESDVASFSESPLPRINTYWLANIGNETKKSESESVKFKVWKCENECVKVKVWKCESESVYG